MNIAQTDLITAASENMVTHFGWIQQQLPGMHLHDIGGITLVDSGLPCDTFNMVCRARLQHGESLQSIRAAIDYFTERERPFSWWVTPGDQPDNLGEMLLGAGLEYAKTETAMAADLDTLASADLAPEGLQIRRVQTPAQLRDFAAVVAANWTPPDPLVMRFYELAEPVVLREDAPLWLYVGYLGDIPVASSELTVGGGVVGLYNICTLEAYRRRGFAAALTLQPLLDARSAGYRTAILQASEAGARVYSRVGFQSFGEVTEYKPPKG